MMKSIPTTYAGVNFRSRLEARWAAFFDLAGWPWEYEPFDLDGWIPDFRLIGKKPALIEVKPIDFRTIAEDDRPLVAHVEAHHADKVAESWFSIDEFLGAPPRFPQNHEIIVAGLSPFPCSMWSGVEAFGVFLREQWSNGDDFAVLARHGDAFDYCAAINSYGYRISGVHDGDSHLRFADEEDVERLWREAGNRVQWQKEDRT